MKQNESLAYYLEDLWSKGFKLSDEDVHFIYVGRNSTNVEEWKVMLAIKETLKFQQTFDPSFYISVLEHLSSSAITTKKSAYRALEKRGLDSSIKKTNPTGILE